MSDAIEVVVEGASVIDGPPLRALRAAPNWWRRCTSGIMSRAGRPDLPPGPYGWYLDDYRVAAAG
jgi:hypothetical protein